MIDADAILWAVYFGVVVAAWFFTNSLEMRGPGE
jgi:hypothetical protein